MLTSREPSMAEVLGVIKPNWVLYTLLVGVFWLLVGAAYIDSSKLYRTMIILLVYIPVGVFCIRNYKYILLFFIKNKPLFILLAALFLYAFINAIIHGDFKGIRHIVYVQLFLLSGILLSSITIQNRFAHFLWLCAYFMVLALVIYSIYSFFILSDNPITRRLWGELGIHHPIISSYYIAFFALLSLFLAVESKKNYYLIGFAICIAFILFAQSRGAYLAFIVALCTYFLFVIKKNKHAVFILLLSIFTCMVLAYLFMDQIEDRGTSHRPELWMAGIKMGAESFWFGHGVNYSYSVFTDNTPRFFVDGFEHSHNLFIHILIQLGFIGLLLFGALWSYCLYVSFKYRKLFLPKFIFVYMVFCSVAYQFDAASFIDTPRLEWMVTWLPIWLVIYFLGANPGVISPENNSAKG